MRSCSLLIKMDADSPEVSGSGSSKEYKSGVRLVVLNLPEDEGEGLGFRLTRTLWDPYPWAARRIRAAWGAIGEALDSPALLTSAYGILSTKEKLANHTHRYLSKMCEESSRSSTVRGTPKAASLVPTTTSHANITTEVASRDFGLRLT
ncbi:hypothetical protein evm_006268 [Chilo suppressalis]|nr:hypothetical protein evm_006268 [Chilo suppressalis]